MLTQGGSQEFPRLLCNPNPKVRYLFHAVVSWAKLFTLYLRQVCFNIILLFTACRSRWLRRMRHGSAAARLLGLPVWFPPRTWTSVSCECCVLSGTGICDGFITYPEESLPIVVCLCVIWKPQQRGGLGPLGLSTHENKWSYRLGLPSGQFCPAFSDYTHNLIQEGLTEGHIIM